jgi:hypothetical protein
VLAVHRVADAPQERTLRSLGDRPAPPELVADLALVAGLPVAARDALWSLLGPCLGDQVPPDLNDQIVAFSGRHGAEPGAVARALRGCRVLVRNAAMLDLAAETLAGDARSVEGAGAPVASMLLRGYDAARRQLHDTAARAAMAEHGRVLEGFDWRLDRVVASGVGGALSFPVVVMTLRCRDGGRPERITFQADPERIRELHGLCEKLLGAASR